MVPEKMRKAPREFDQSVSASRSGLPSFAGDFRVFLHPLRKHPFWILGISLVLALVGYGWDSLIQTVEPNIAFLYQANTEMHAEAGPSYARSMHQQAKSLSIAIPIMQRRLNKSRIMSLVLKTYPELKSTQLESAVAELSERKCDDESALPIMRHVESAVQRDYERLSRFLIADEVKLRPSIELTDEEKEAIYEAIEQFDVAVKRLEKHPSAQNAESACMASRHAALLLVAAWCEFRSIDRTDRVAKFTGNLQRAFVVTRNLVDDVSTERERKILEKYSQSLDRRQKVFKRLRADNTILMDSVLNPGDDVAAKEAVRLGCDLLCGVRWF